MKGFNEDEFLDFVEFVKDKDLELRFIEFMPFDSNNFSKDKMIPYSEIKKRIEEKYKLVKMEDGPNATSKVRILVFI